MAKYPKLTHKEINDEVVKRTGQSSQLVGAVIRAYRDVMREAIINGVEVVIPEMCTLTFRDHPPRPAGEYWDGLTKTRHYFPNRQGYYALNIKPHEKVKQGISVIRCMVTPPQKKNGWNLLRHIDLTSKCATGY